jgi:hypothetical protein
LTSIEKGKSTWQKMFDRLGSYYDTRFHGTDWREKEKEFWEEKMNRNYPY